MLGVEALPEFLTVEEAADLLRIDRKTCYDAITRREIPGARKLGRVIRLHTETLLAWFQSDAKAKPRAK